jgi:hypothetical protein
MVLLLLGEWAVLEVSLRNMALLGSAELEVQDRNTHLMEVTTMAVEVTVQRMMVFL